MYLKSPFPCGAGYKNERYILRIPENVGLKNLCPPTNLCFIQQYAISVETRDYTACARVIIGERMDGNATAGIPNTVCPLDETTSFETGGFNMTKSGNKKLFKRDYATTSTTATLSNIYSTMTTKNSAATTTMTTTTATNTTATTTTTTTTTTPATTPNPASAMNPEGDCINRAPDGTIIDQNNPHPEITTSIFEHYPDCPPNYSLHNATFYWDSYDVSHCDRTYSQYHGQQPSCLSMQMRCILKLKSYISDGGLVKDGSLKNHTKELRNAVENQVKKCEKVATAANAAAQNLISPNIFEGMDLGVVRIPNDGQLGKNLRDINTPTYITRVDYCGILKSFTEAGRFKGVTSCYAQLKPNENTPYDFNGMGQRGGGIPILTQEKYFAPSKSLAEMSVTLNEQLAAEEAKREADALSKSLSASLYGTSTTTVNATTMTASPNATTTTNATISTIFSNTTTTSTTNGISTMTASATTSCNETTTTTIMSGSTIQAYVTSSVSPSASTVTSIPNAVASNAISGYANNSIGSSLSTPTIPSTSSISPSPSPLSSPASPSATSKPVPSPSQSYSPAASRITGYKY